AVSVCNWIIPNLNNTRACVYSGYQAMSRGVTPSIIYAVSEGSPRAYDIILKINRSTAIS
ncbi:MAG: hypothetical protein MJE68_18705, partial [Proteobacteria bacterium]|nr:hypothetical protein [Pseudomonadota bacterium]